MEITKNLDLQKEYSVVYVGKSPKVQGFLRLEMQKENLKKLYAKKY